MAKSVERMQEWETVAIFVFGVVFVLLLLGLSIFFPHPTDFQYFVFRTVIALAAAGVAALIPGLLRVEVPAIRAGGALAVLILVYQFSPASLVAQTPPEQPVKESGAQQPRASLGAKVVKICIGDYETKCLPHDEWRNCAATAREWARHHCASSTIQQLDTRPGDGCGYSLDQVICTGFR